jgi:hypothetical protein
VVFELALDIAQHRRGAEAEQVGARASARPAPRFIRICQASASFAVRMPPAGLKPISKPVRAP